MQVGPNYYPMTDIPTRILVVLMKLVTRSKWPTALQPGVVDSAYVPLV